MTDGRLKGVMIGAGFFAANQAEAWMRISGADLSAVADPIPGKAREFADRWGIPAAYTNAIEMFDAEQPAFVDIVTRPESHHELVTAAAQRGIDVICQKPMAPTWDECLAMVESCRQAGVRLLVHENWRWQPWYREVKRLVDQDRLGRVFQLSVSVRTGDGRGDQPYTVQPYFREMKRLLVYETLVHHLDTLRYLEGDIASLFCHTARINPMIQGEDCALIHVQFRGGSHGIIDANRISGPLPPPLTLGTLLVEGDRGAVRLTPDGKLWLKEYGLSESEHVYPWSDRGYKGDSVFATQAHLVDCLREGRVSESEGQDYLATVAAVFACYESAQTGRPVAVWDAGDKRSEICTMKP